MLPVRFRVTIPFPLNADSVCVAFLLGLLQVYVAFVSGLLCESVGIVWHWMPLLSCVRQLLLSVESLLKMKTTKARSCIQALPITIHEV